MKARNESAGQEISRARVGRSVSPARRAAFEILRRVEEDAAYASVLLAAIDERMRQDDRALCYELVLGVLRWQLWLDALIKHFADREAESLDAPIRRALRMGLYELRFLTRIPASATVNEAVNLAYLARLRSAAGFVNAVLRRATREIEFDPSTGIDDPLERLSIATSHPAWLIERWVKSFGLEIAEEFAFSNNKPPPNAFRLSSGTANPGTANPGTANPGTANSGTANPGTAGVPARSPQVLETLQSSGGLITPSKIVPGAFRIQGATAEVRDLSNQGLIYLQDEASQLVAHVLGAQPGENVLDVCAAPGSKATHIANIEPQLVQVVAGDLYQHRLRTLLNTGIRLGAGRISALAYDATTTLPFKEQSFDRVLVDAPCTGTGTLRRNPEIKWRITAEDISNVANRQSRILANSAVVVNCGGKLVYSTCSVEVEENEDIVEGFLNGHPEFAPIPVEVNGLLKSIHGSVRTWPQRDGADGFFIAVFERRR